MVSFKIPFEGSAWVKSCNNDPNDALNTPHQSPGLGISGEGLSVRTRFAGSGP